MTGVQTCALPIFGYQRQDFIRDHVPEQDRPPGRSQEARAVDNVGDPVFNRLDQRRVAGGVIFEISVLDNRVFGTGGEDPFSNRGAFSFVFLRKNNVNDRIVFVPFQDFARAVGRSVVDAEDLIRQSGFLDAPDNFFERFLLRYIPE